MAGLKITLCCVMITVDFAHTLHDCFHLIQLKYYNGNRFRIKWCIISGQPEGYFGINDNLIFVTQTDVGIFVNLREKFSVCCETLTETLQKPTCCLCILWLTSNNFSWALVMRREWSRMYLVMGSVVVIVFSMSDAMMACENYKVVNAKLGSWCLACWWHWNGKVATMTAISSLQASIATVFNASRDEKTCHSRPILVD